MEHVSLVRPTGKFPEKVENLKRWSRFPGWNFRTECRVPFTFLVVCTSSRSTVGHRATYRGLRPNGTTFYQSEIPLLLSPKFPGFFPKWKAPYITPSNKKLVPVIYCQTRGKTVNTWKISGMLIVYWSITIKFRTREQTSKPQTIYRFRLRFSYLVPHWFISCNTITFHKYFWCSRFCEFRSKNCRSLQLSLRADDN